MGAVSGPDESYVVSASLKSCLGSGPPAGALKLGFAGNAARSVSGVPALVLAFAYHPGTT
jgi:hypothetical protein